jgi:hypothetical protein
MNVLVLTPDAVGSTLLQRLITIYMQFCDYDRPVINLHELASGLIKYYNPNFEQEVLGKPKGYRGYSQTLLEISNLLKSVDHYKTARLAHYHIVNRQESIEDQLPFYDYLNENFLIVACRRHNVFEYGLSFVLRKITKKFNVYSAEEKVNSFFQLYRDKVTIDPSSLLQSLEAYKSYVHWCDDHFSVVSYFYYEEHLPNIERFIMDLPLFNNQPKKLTWHDNFDINFTDWNKCHYLLSDIGTLALTNQEEFAKLTYDNTNKTSIQSTSLTLPAEHVNFLETYSKEYFSAADKINNMIDQGIMISPPPIKKHTMQEKRFLIKNFDQLVEVYNKWIELNPTIGNPIDNSTIEKFIGVEQQYWNPQQQTNLITKTNN